MKSLDEKGLGRCVFIDAWRVRKSIKHITGVKRSRQGYTGLQNRNKKHLQKMTTFPPLIQIAKTKDHGVLVLKMKMKISRYL